jgi:hypothetical protein
MKAIRLGVVAVAAGALLALALVAGLSARGAFAQAASPSAGAAQAVYCPKGEKNEQKRERNAYLKTLHSERAAYFARHPKSSDRVAFLKRQHSDWLSFLKKHRHCDNDRDHSHDDDDD